jgi:Right handed beta helix region/FlgD Ig-like domain
MFLRIVEISFFALVAVLFLLRPESLARTILVPEEQPTLKAAIVTSEDGDTILVATGTYTGPNNRDLDFGNKKIVLQSMKGAATAVIDCQGTAESPHRAFWIHQGEDSTTVIKGFLIINGYAPPIGPDSASIGGAILCENNSSPTIKNCLFYDNVAESCGGALACLTGAAPRMLDCTFSSNFAQSEAGSGFAGYGGAIYCNAGNPILRNCIITSNRAHLGGGIFGDESLLDMAYCRITANVADTISTGNLIQPGGGAGLCLVQGSSGNLAYCTIDKNIALVGVAGNELWTAGGGFLAQTSSFVLQNCTFFGNVAEKSSDTLSGRGAALYTYHSTGQIANSIFANNLQAEALTFNISSPGDSIYVPELSCCDIVGNELGDWVGEIADQEGQNGNFSREPIFCNSGAGNYHLWVYSPCLPDSNSCGSLIGANDVGCLTDVDNPGDTRPADVVLKQNHPNPFNQATMIEYSTGEYAHVVITIHNLLGQRVRRLVETNQPPGFHSVIWDGRDNTGRDVAAGVYIYSLKAGPKLQTRKMIVLK